MDQVWGVSVSTARGHKVYHTAADSETDAKNTVLKINEDEDPHIEGIERVDNLWHIKPGTCQQIMP
jgi:hypothetical protein